MDKISVKRDKNPQKSKTLKLLYSLNKYKLKNAE